MLTKRHSMSLFVYCLNILISRIGASSYQTFRLSPHLVSFSISLTLFLLHLRIDVYIRDNNRAVLFLLTKYIICHLRTYIYIQIKNISCKYSITNLVISDLAISRQVETEERRSTEGAIKSRSPSTHTQQYATTATMTSLSWLHSPIPHSSCLSSLLSSPVSDYQYKNAGRILHDKSGGKVRSRVPSGIPISRSD